MSKDSNWFPKRFYKCPQCAFATKHRWYMVKHLVNKHKQAQNLAEGLAKRTEYIRRYLE